MPKQKNDSDPSPVKPVTQEPTTDAAEATVSKDDVGAATSTDPMASNIPEPARDQSSEAVLDDTARGPETSEPITAPNRPAEAEASEETSGSGNQALPPLSKSSEATATEQANIEDVGNEESPGMKMDALDSTTIRSSIDAAVASDVHEMADRPTYRRNPWKMMPVPTCPERYGTTNDLFARIKQTFIEQTHLSDNVCKLLTFWAILSWFQEILPLTPGLGITGWAYEGEIVLRTLRAFCRNPILVAGLTSATLNNIYLHWEKNPTLLISEPGLSKRLAVLLGSSTSRGYLALIKMECAPPFAFDYFGSKAIYLGENPPVKSMLQYYLHINASVTSQIVSDPVPLLSEEVIQRFQNQLEDYRRANWEKISRQRFNASGLSPEVQAIANAFAQCIVDAPDLTEELVALLASRSEQQLAERLDDLGTLVVGSFLSLCHQGKTQILVGEIAAEGNRILKARGEKLQYSPENVGRKLNKIGLTSRRLGAAGNGFVMDRRTQILLHEVAAAYGCVGLTDDNEKMNCPLCEQYK